MTCLCITKSKKLSYADDTTIAAIGDSITDIESTLNNDVNQTSQWCNKSDMVVSTPKSCSMLVASRQKWFPASKSQKDMSLDIKLNNNPIPW